MTRIGNSLEQFILGLKSPWIGFDHIRKNKPLKRLVSIPMLIVLLLFILCIFLTYTFSPPLVSNLAFNLKTWFLARWPDFLDFKIFYSLGAVLLTCFKLLFYVVLFTFNLIFAWLIGNVLCSFFWELLAEKILSQSLLFKKDMLLKVSLKNILKSMFRELIKELVLIIMIAIVWLMTFIPLLGQGIALLVFPLVTAFLLGYLYMDYAMSVLGLSLIARVNWAKRHIPFLLGSGIYGLFFPVVYFLYPSFIVGGLLQHRDHILSHAKDI